MTIASPPVCRFSSRFSTSFSDTSVLDVIIYCPLHHILAGSLSSHPYSREKFCTRHANIHAPCEFGGLCGEPRKCVGRPNLSTSKTTTSLDRRHFSSEWCEHSLVQARAPKCHEQNVRNDAILWAFFLFCHHRSSRYGLFFDHIHV